MSVPEKHIGARTSNIKGRPETPTASNRRFCPYCRGLGKTVVRQEWHEDGRPKKTEYQICGWCHGRGWQPADCFEFPPPGTISVGDYTAKLRHPFSIGYHTGGADDQVHQEFDRDMIEVKGAGGGLMIPKALVEDARDGKGLLDVIRENMVKAQVEKNEEMAARVLAKRKTVAELAQDLYPTYGAFAHELARSIKAGTPLRKAYAQIKDRGRRMHDLSKALASCAPLAHAAGARTIKELTAELFPTYGPFAQELAEGLVKARVRRFLKPRSQLPSSSWATRSLRDDEMTPDHVDLSRAIRFASLRENRGIPSWDKDKGQEQ